MYVRALSITGVKNYDYWIKRMNRDLPRHKKTAESIRDYIDSKRSHYSQNSLRIIKLSLTYGFRATYKHIKDVQFWHDAEQVLKSIKTGRPTAPRSDVFLTEQEVRRIIDCAPNQRIAIIIYLYAITGCRISELRLLKMRHCKLSSAIDPLTNKRFSVVRMTVIGKGKAREVIIREQDFKRAKTILLSKQYLIERQSGGHYSHTGLHHLIQVAGEAASIPLFAHKLRHSFASNMLRHGATLPEVSKYIGHSNPVITARYYLHGQMRPDVLFNYLKPERKSKEKKTKNESKTKTNADSANAGFLRTSQIALSEVR